MIQAIYLFILSNDNISVYFNFVTNQSPHEERLYRLVLLGLVAVVCKSNAQEIQITNIQLNGDDIEISYNIIDERIDRSYQSIYTTR